MNQRTILSKGLGFPIENIIDLGKSSFGDLIETVRQGYRVAAIPYNEQKDIRILNMPIFQHWMSIIPDGIVAELGCGSGFPVAHHIANAWKNTGKRYLGIDLSEEQIDIAKQLLGAHHNICSFTVREMMDWCRKQKDNSIAGLLAFFSIYHLPRNQHVDLLSQIFRILKENAPLLFSAPAKSFENYDINWLGISKMYWSSFSVEWYEITARDIGFEFISKSRDMMQNSNVDFHEETYYLLYVKPPTPLDVHPPIVFPSGPHTDNQSTPESPSIALFNQVMPEDSEALFQQ